MSENSFRIKLLHCSLHFRLNKLDFLFFSFNVYLNTCGGLLESSIGIRILNTIYCVRRNAITIIKMPSGHTVFHCFHLKLLCMLNLSPNYIVLHCTTHYFLRESILILRLGRNLTHVPTSHKQVSLSWWAFFLNTNYHHDRKQGLLRLGESDWKNLIWLIIAASKIRVVDYVLY